MTDPVSDIATPSPSADSNADADLGKDDVPPNPPVCPDIFRPNTLIKGNVMCRRSLSRLNRLAFVSYDPSGLVGAIPTLRNRFDRHIKEGQTNMDVSGIGSVSGATPARGVTSAASQPATPSHVVAPKDELEISAAGKMLDRLSETPEVRAERLAQIKEAIDNGAYDTDEKLEAALSKMFGSLGIDLDDE